MIQLIILSVILLFLAMAGLGIKLLFDKKAEFKGGSCQSTASSVELQEKGISCGCGSECEG